ncbi:hypothetical protein Taro_016192 [Colocasia esculenta]|uniref:Uncharacterized protein n=1 Tax=Colocasia esculenta TaxID=4460 RepID=A0A843UVI4_COLES|nr:hypothetical protein [Colocasia esculenta]
MWEPLERGDLQRPCIKTH